MAKKTNAELLAALAAATSDAAKAAILDEQIGAITAELYNSVDAVLTEVGYTKPAGEKTLTAIANFGKLHTATQKELTTSKAAADKAAADLAAFMAKAPDVELLRTEHAKTLAAKESEWQAEISKTKREVVEKTVAGRAATVKVADQFKTVMPAILQTHVSKLLNEYAIVEDGNEIFIRDKQNPTISIRDAKGMPLTVDAYFTEHTKDFAPIEKPNGYTPPAAGGTGSSQSSTTADRIAYAKANNINIQTKEGQDALSQAFPQVTK